MFRITVMSILFRLINYRVNRYFNISLFFSTFSLSYYLAIIKKFNRSIRLFILGKPRVEVGGSEVRHFAY